jgi:hypothetical protein
MVFVFDALGLCLTDRRALAMRGMRTCFGRGFMFGGESQRAHAEATLTARFGQSFQIHVAGATPHPTTIRWQIGRQVITGIPSRMSVAFA